MSRRIVPAAAAATLALAATALPWAAGTASAQGTAAPRSTEAETSAAPKEPPTQADAQQLVDHARQALRDIAADAEFSSLRQELAQAPAVLVFPRVVRAGFVVGGAGGTGVLLVRQPGGGWAGPAFYTLGSASLGLQAGATTSEVVLVIRSQKTLESLYRSSVKLGADASVALGARGAARAATASDMVVYARSKGAFAGVTIEGAVLDVRQSLNAAYYGKPASPVDILVSHSVRNPQAAPLHAALREIAAGRS